MGKVIFLLGVCFTLGFVLAKQDEKEVLVQFRKRVLGNLTKDYMKTDLYLTKWLKASDYDISDAEEMFYENLKWRQENSMDVEQDFSDMVHDFPAYTDTKDKQGRPVGHINYGKWDIRAAAVHGKLSRLNKYMCYIYESLDRKVWKARDDGLNVSHAILILNLDGFNDIQHLCPPCISFFIQMGDCHETHYPYLAKEFIYINVPMKFSVLVNAGRPVANKDTAKTLKIFTDKSKWLPYLDQRVDPDQRYHFAGGTLMTSELID